jgi:branched-chain amino acid transport system substrate-binding protein
MTTATVERRLRITAPAERVSSLLLLLACIVLAACQTRDRPPEVKVALVDFVSGSVARSGMNAVNGGKLVIDQINARGGIGGVPMRALEADEAGTVEQVVRNYRRLVLDERVDAVIGYTSSASCLAIAPVADELRALTIVHTCGTYRLFEEQPRAYVVRAGSHGAADSVSAALYLLAVRPDLGTVAAINDDYAWGRDAWAMFAGALRRLRPGVQVVEELWPRPFVGEYSTEIRTLLAARPDAIFTSMWGVHLDVFIQQGQARGLFGTTLVVMSAGETALLSLGREVPPGIAMSGRGRYLLSPDPARDELNRQFIADYTARYGEIPVYPAYRMAQAIYGLKAAWEAAIQARRGAWPSTEDVIAAFHDLSYRTPSGLVTTQANHDSRQDAVFGITSARLDPRYGFPLLERVRVFPAERVNPPAGTRTREWIERGAWGS